MMDGPGWGLGRRHGNDAEEDHTSAEKQKGFHTPGVGRAGKAELPANTQLITDL